MKRYDSYKDSGIEWIGEIPSHWKIMKTSHCFEQIGSGTTPTAGNPEYYENGEFNWLQTGDLTDGEIFETSKRITQKALNNYSALRFYSKDSLVIAMYGATIGKTGFLKIETTTNQACCVLSKPKNLNSRFAFYLLNYIKPHLISLSYGGGQPNINQEQIRNLKINCPPFSEQISIISYLDKKTSEIDRLIADKEELLKLYEEEKTAVINQAVTKGINPKVKMKDSGIEWLGEIPEHWEVKKIKFLGKFINGFSFKSTEFTNEGVRVLKISNIQHMRIDWLDESFINKEAYNTHRNFRVLENDLVFALTRPIISSGIKAALISSNDQILLNQRNSLFRPHKFNVKWFYYILLSSDFINEFDKRIDKTGQQPNISSNDIGDIVIPIPKNELEQQSIVDFIESETTRIDAKIEDTQKLIELLKEYRTALISEVVTGKVKVIQD